MVFFPEIHDRVSCNGISSDKFCSFAFYPSNIHARYQELNIARDCTVP